ncbi:unnamed protein product [Auanema sp. JU1783]|nr:unnamed protein product [Auanema sp. JU1783]
MGNKSSTPSYPYWNHPSYSVPFDGKRGLNGTPGVYVEPYVPHFHRSMVSLHDSGYLTSPGGTMANQPHRNSRLYGSRISLNQMPMPAGPPPIPDTKTLKKLEKMQKKHDKLVKKLAARGQTYGGPMMVGPMHPMVHPQPAVPPGSMFPYPRAMSYDNLQRAQLDMAEMRLREEWRKAHPNRKAETTTNKSTVSSSSTCVRAPRAHGSFTSSSPVTSSSDGRTVEQWNSFTSSHEKTTTNSSESEKNNNKSYEKTQIHSPIQNIHSPLYMSTPKSESKDNRESNVHNIVVKVERNDKPEMSRKEDTKMKSNESSSYAQPIIHQRDQSSFGSRTSMGTSQFRCDQSEIDFSWVTEEENRLRSEKTNRIDDLPECYFGIEPPLPSSADSRTLFQSNSKEGKENQKHTSVKQAATIFEEEARRIRSRDQHVGSTIYSN